LPGGGRAVARRCRRLLAIVALALPAAGQAAEPWVSLEVAAESGTPSATMAAWAELLEATGFDHVRIRGIRNGDRPSLQVRAEGGRQRYALVGVLDRRERLLLPEAAFERGDRSKLTAYRAQLASGQPLNEPPGPLGLAASHFARLYAELSPRLGAAGSAPAAPLEVVEAALAELAAAPAWSPGARAALQQAAPLEVDLSGLSRGSAAAYALREAGLALAPLPPRSAGAGAALAVVPAAEAAHAWPVGWRSAATPKTLAPQMFRVTTIEIAGYTLAQTMTALGPHLGVPLLVDRPQLARLQIVPTKATVDVKKAFDQALARAHLASELRVDERGTPFLWITQFGPGSGRAAAAPPADGD
jgi:hypothetical protein